MAKFLLIGGTGFIGQALGVKLVERGDDVTVLTRDAEKFRNQMPFPCDLFEWQEPDFKIPHGLLDQHDVIVNFSGASVATTKWNKNGQRLILNSRVMTTQALVKQLNDISSDKVLIQASAIGFYGDRKDEILDERSERGDKGFLPEVCVAWEAQLQALANSKTRVCTLRFGAVLGFGGGALEQLDSLYSSGFGACLGNGAHYFSWIHIDDICNIILKVSDDASCKGVYNVTAPAPIRFKELHERLRQVKRVGTLPAVPEIAMKLIFGKQSEFLLASQRVVPKRLEQAGYKFGFPNIESALTDLYAHQRKPGVFTVLRKIWIAKSPKELWPFFCDEKNLEVLTPTFLNFHVVGKSTSAIQEGTLIDYRLKIHGVPAKWQSRIESWQPPFKFVDTQVKGPYSYWYHEHMFEPLGQGTLATDRIQYTTPIGRVGAMASGALISRDVANIFNFRAKTIADIFGQK